MKKKLWMEKFLLVGLLIVTGGCTAKVVGDPNRPITINAHIVLDIKGLQDTAVNIEDYVGGKTSEIDIN